MHACKHRIFLIHLAMGLAQAHLNKKLNADIHQSKKKHDYSQVYTKKNPVEYEENFIKIPNYMLREYRLCIISELVGLNFWQHFGH